MGNYILFSDNYVPVQTGSDVHCLFYRPAEALATPDPKECFHALADHASMTGRRFEVGYAAALESFCEILESRKDGLNGCWFTAPGESSKEAFMRRLKRSDPDYDISQAYAEEHSERWASATALSMDQALAEMPEIERKYLLECEEETLDGTATQEGAFSQSALLIRQLLRQREALWI